MEYKLVKSGRKTLAVYVRDGGVLEVRAPLGVSRAKIEQFLQGKSEWIARARERIRLESAQYQHLAISRSDIATYRKRLAEYLTGNLPAKAAILGVDYAQVKIGGAMHRWASCSSDGNLNFSWRVAMLPPELAEYILVHELAHRREMNHSSAFWNVVGSVMPDYRERRKALKRLARIWQIEKIMEEEKDDAKL